MIPFFQPYYKYFFKTISLNVLLVAVDVLVPLFQSYAIDHFIIADTLEGIRPFACLYAAVIMMQGVSVFFSVRAAIHIEMHVGKDLKRAQFVHLQKLSFSYYNTTPVGYIHARVMSDTSKIASVLAWGLVDMFWALVYVIGVFVIMFLLNWKLAAIIMLIVPLIAVLTAVFQTKMLFWNRKVREINSQITGAYNEGITGVETSKTLSMETLNDISFQAITERMKNSSMTLAKLTAVYMPMILFCSSAVTAFVLARGGYLVQNQIIALGTLSVFLSYAVGIFEPIQQLARLLSDLISCQANIERVVHLLEQEPNVTDRPDVIEKYGDSVHLKKENWERIRENIRYGRLSASDEEVEEAAKSVSADEVIRKLEFGYDTNAGEGGNRLSTGEKQLISFARAILAEPAIFVLDEATSSIDTWTEQLIQKATERLLKGHTAFMIAHRLSTIRNADIILVMKDGKIIEQGNHRELIGQKGYYYELYSKQFKEEQMMEVLG